MHRLAILVCALAPSLVLLQYGIAKAQTRWDDAMIWETYFTGSMAAMLALLSEHVLKKAIAIDAMSPVHGAATEALFVAAIPEELAKLVVLFFVLKRHGNEADRHDFINLSFAVALGFAAIENLGYLLLPGDWHFVALNRAALSVPMHGLDGLAMGAFLTAASLSRRNRGIWLCAALIVPILLHALFDFPLMLVARKPGFSGVLPAWLLLEVLLTIGVLWWSNRMRAAADLSGFQQGAINPKHVGIAIFLLAPLLALSAILQGSSVGIAAVAMFIVPSIFAIDLLWTNRAMTASYKAAR
jgi:RsiW-degrading membrane proteinase PrsW (M82 family)